MKYFYADDYKTLKNEILPTVGDICIVDHLGGFTEDWSNNLLDSLKTRKFKNSVYLQYVIDPQLREKYKLLDIRFSSDLQNTINFLKHKNYKIHPELTFKNFVCSFNGSPHVSRKLLVSALHRFNWFNANYCSKNFSYSSNVLDGHLEDYTDQISFYRKFFISPHSEDFFQTINSFGHIKFNHSSNIHNLEGKLTESFIHIVSETMATSYVPFVTEKFLYSVVTRGLFLAYAQPHWHEHLEKYYGFKKYTKLFDYQFDEIQNPVERLVCLMTMISKFSILSADDWRDLYLLQQDEIEYNYNHYFSGEYLRYLKQYE
jgi:hypothetical protein